MAETTAINDKNFEDEVINSDIPVLVDFWAEWCMPCRMVAPIVEELAKEYTGKMKFVSVDVDANPDTAMKYNIRSIPALIVFKNGVPVDQIVGAVPKSALQEKVDSSLT
jgi:thioredoxin 1